MGIVKRETSATDWGMTMEFLLHKDKNQNWNLKKDMLPIFSALKMEI
jgi:hypothetical protein